MQEFQVIRYVLLKISAHLALMVTTGCTKLKENSCNSGYNLVAGMMVKTMYDLGEDVPIQVRFCCQFVFVSYVQVQ